METLSPSQRRLVYARLLQGLEAQPAKGGERWDWLMAAHVVGQHHMLTHFDSHRRMLFLALQQRDWPEVRGQLLRLLLLPLGHLVNRVPLGNIGRSSAGLTQRMEPPEPVQQLIDWATLATSFQRG